MSAERLLIIAPKEWEAGKVRVKNLGSREELDIVVADLVSMCKCD